MDLLVVAVYLLCFPAKNYRMYHVNTTSMESVNFLGFGLQRQPSQVCFGCLVLGSLTPFRKPDEEKVSLTCGNSFQPCVATMSTASRTKWTVSSSMKYGRFSRANPGLVQTDNEDGKQMKERKALLTIVKRNHTRINSHCFTAPHITSHHVTTSHHITSHHNTTQYNTSHHIKSHHITSHHITSHHIKSNQIKSNHITSHHITSHHITSNHKWNEITSHHIASHDMTWHDMTWHDMTWHDKASQLKTLLFQIITVTVDNLTSSVLTS